MIHCPIKSLKAWKNLVKVQGEDLAYILWNEYNGAVPDKFYKQESIQEESFEELKPIPIPEKKRGQEDPLIRHKYFKEGSETKSLDVLNKIAESNHPLNNLARHLIKYAENINVPIRLLPQEGVQGSRGIAAAIYDHRGFIEIAEYTSFRGLGSEPTLIHEIIHSLTVHKLKEDGNIQRQLQKLLDYAKTHPSLEGQYAITNVEEFVTGVMTDAKFIKLLTEIEPSKEVDTYRNFLAEVLDYILGMFKIESTDNLYAQSFSVITNLLEEVNNESLSPDHISEAKSLFDVGEINYSETNGREYSASKAAFSRNNTIHPLKSKIKNPNIKEVVVQEVLEKGKKISVYPPEIGESEVKRYVVNKYFRYTNKQGELTKPHLPFTAGNIYIDQKIVKTINSEFTQPVVYLEGTTETINFTKEADKALSFQDVEDVLFNEITLPEMEKRMSELKENIVGQEDIDEILFLTTEDKTKSKEKLESWDKTIQRKEELIRLFQKSIAEGSPRRAELRARISLLQTQIDALTAKQNDQIVIDTAQEDNRVIQGKLSNIEANLEKIELFDENQLWNIISDLNEIGAYIQGWQGLSSTLLDLKMFPEIRKEINALSGSFEDLRQSQINLLKKVFLSYVNKVSYKKFIEEDLTKALIDEGKLSRWVLGAKHSPSEYVRIINDLFNKAAYNINREAYEKRKELDLILDKLKKHTGITNEAKLSSMFLQYYEDGRFTGNFVGRIKQEYFDKKFELLYRAKETNNKEDWKAYYDFIRKNATVITEEIYKARNNPNFTEKDFQRQDEFIRIYEQDKKKFIDSLLDGGLYEEGSDEFIMAVAEWERINSPWSVSEVGSQGWKYRIYEKPHYDKWKDNNYDKIQKDPVLKEAYEFFVKRFEENNKELPHFQGFQSNYLPEMRKTSMERFMENKGVGALMSLLNDELKLTVMESADSEIDNEINIAGKSYKTIPVSMMAGILTPEEKSRNIFQIIRAHTLMSLNYKYKSEVEPIASAAMDLIKETKAIEEVNKEGKILPKRDIYDNVKEKELINTIGRLQYLVDATLYNERKDTEFKGKTEKTLSTGQKVVFSQAKAVDSLIKFTYVKALSIPNFVTPTVNLTLGVAQNFTYASAGRNIDSASLLWAYSKMMQTFKRSIAEKYHWQDAIKVVAWMRHLNVLDDINESAYGDVESWDRMLTILQSKGEYFNQGAVMMAYLKKNTVKDKNGNDISIIDAFKIENGTPVWDKEKMGEMTEPTPQEIISSDGRGVNMFRLRQKIKGINHYIHGDYASVLEGKRTSLGRALMLFKTWLFQTWIHRFGKEDFDPDLLETVKGRYRSYLSATTQEGLELRFKDIIKILVKGAFSRKSFDSLSEVDKDNLIRNMREIQFIVGLYVLAALLMAAGADDDDEVTKKSLNLAINMISKTQSDMMFYLDPGSAGQILNNVIAPINTLNDLMSLGSAIVKTAQGDFTYQSGPWKDKNRIMVGVSRNLPIANGGIKMWNMASQVYSFN